MRAALVSAALVVLVAAGCGSDDPPKATAVVVERRAITDAERSALSHDDGHDPLECDEFHAAMWDYGAPSDSEAGREPEDALVDAIDDLDGQVPATGWVELRDDTDRIFVIEDDGQFLASVEVSGVPARGIWRHQQAFACPDLGE